MLRIRVEKALAVAIAIFALLAVWSHWPYVTYTILRFALCAMSAYLAVRSYGVGQRAWVWIGGITAALFNPFFPLHLQRSQWRILDFGAAFVLALWAWKVRLPESAQQQPSQSSPPLQTTELAQPNKMLKVANAGPPSRKTRVLVCDDEPARTENPHLAYICVDRDIITWERVARLVVDCLNSPSEVRVLPRDEQGPIPRFRTERLERLNGGPADAEGALTAHIRYLARNVRDLGRR